MFQAIKGLFRKSISRIISTILRFWPRKSSTANPILPIQKPASTTDHNSPPLVQPLLVSKYIQENDDDIVVDVAFSNHDEIKPIPAICVPDNYSSLVQPLLFSNLLSTNDNYDYNIQENDHDILVDVVFSNHDEISPIPAICVPDVFKQEIAPQEEKEEEEEVKAVIIRGGVSGDEEEIICRWIKHYSSRQRILVVGDGDFSFSVSLALAFGSASNMISTSLNSIAFLKNNYQNALLNIMELKGRKCKVIHGIDATEMANCALLEHLKFDRVIFNFPFAGFFKNLSRESELRRHRRLVSLFLKNAREMISGDGEIHITHKTNGFHVEWKLESVASCHGLRLIEAVKFNHLDYPGYNTKCGFGGNGNFNCNPSKTYKFGLKKTSSSTKY